MKPTSQIIALGIIITLLFALGPLTLNAQELKENTSDFKILMQRQGNEVILKCEEGGAWKTLSYNNQNEEQAINELGMTSIETNKDSISGMSHFLITISKTENGLSMKGLKGTAWRDLSFTLPEFKTQAINRFGMTD